MTVRPVFAIFGGVAAAAIAVAGIAAPPATVGGMRGDRRVLIVATPDGRDPRYVRQMRTLAGWTADGDRRDVTVVRIVGNRVVGASDTAAALRRRYALAMRGFAVVLVGKDGHVAVTSATPLAPATLSGTIDAMPMRRAGQR